MKKWMFILILGISVASICSKCEDGILDEGRGKYYIKNRTNQTLIVILPPALYERSWNIPSGDSILINRIPSFAEPDFDRWPHDEMVYFGADKSLDVLSTDSVLLKKWNYADINLPGKQLFNESSWCFYQKTEGDGRIVSIWTFDILPKDISE